MIRPDPIFTDNIVFAENKPIRVYGTGEGDVTVRFLGADATAVCENGAWIAELPAAPGGGPYEMTISFSGRDVILHNVCVGKVYFFLGQSNVEFRLGESNTPQELYADDPLFRDFFVDRPWNKEDPLRTSDGWIPARRYEVADWSAIGYLTGRLVREAAGCAVGIICCYQGASVIESWLPEPVAKKYRLPGEMLYEDHKFDVFSAFNDDGAIYDNMLSRVARFPATGVVWYQGESDSTVEESAVYPGALSTLFGEIRRLGGDGDLPFVIVQIHDCEYRQQVLPEGWCAMQKAQEKAARDIPRTALVVSRDVCETNAMHPPTKTKLSERIAEALLKFD